MTAIEVAAAAPVRRPGRGVRGLSYEFGSALWSPIRLLLRHGPVLFVLAVAGVGSREGLIHAAVFLAGVNAYLGFIVFLMAPVAVIVSVVLMLLVLRPSLTSLPDRRQNRPILRDLGNVLIPFVAFYMAFGQMTADYREYNAGLTDHYEAVDAQYFGYAQNDVRVWGLSGENTQSSLLILFAIVVVAFALRWALDKWELTRRNPVLGLPGAFLEVVWVVLGLRYVFQPVAENVRSWAGERRAWHAVLDWWHGLSGVTGTFGQLYHLVDSRLVAAIPSGNVNRIFVIPITGLVSAAVVYRLTVSDALRPPVLPGRLRWLRWAVGGLTYAISRRFAPLVQGVRAMGRSGVLPVMFFCLTVVVLESAGQWLRKLEWVLLGPRIPGTFQYGLYNAIEGFNGVVTFVLLACVLAAAVDGMSRRTAHRREPAPEPVLAVAGLSDRDPDVVR